MGNAESTSLGPYEKKFSPCLHFLRCFLHLLVKYLLMAEISFIRDGSDYGSDVLIDFE